MNQSLFTFENLLKAYQRCRKNKGMTDNHLAFRLELEKNLLALERELKERTYRPGRSIAFVVTRPKVREIFAADFRDRVVHHLLFSYLSPIFEKQFIHDSWACREGKGTHGAMLRLQDFTCRQTKEAGLSGKGFYLQMDIKSFFMSIDKEILYKLVARRTNNSEVLWLARVVIMHDPARDIPPRLQSSEELFSRLPPGKSLFGVEPGKGLPIGNLTSQFFANVYMNEFDRFVKHVLKCRYYVRYVDDWVVLGDNQQWLRQVEVEMAKFLQEQLALVVHPLKTIVRPIQNGIDFVGYIVRPTYILVRRRVVGGWRRARDGAGCQEELTEVNCQYLAHTGYANASELARCMQFA